MIAGPLQLGSVLRSVQFPERRACWKERPHETEVPDSGETASGTVK